MRSIDGDLPCDGTGLPRIYKSGSIYVHLNDDSLLVKRVIYTCMYMYVLFMLGPSACADHVLDILCMHICVYISISLAHLQHFSLW